MIVTAARAFGPAGIDAPGGPPEEPLACPLVPLVSTTDVAFLPMVKSLLESVGIPFVVQGEQTLNLLPVGPFAGGTNRGGALRATIHVPEDRLEEALALLRERAQVLDGGP